MTYVFKVLVWLVAFLAATFCWLVFFVHGAGIQAFAEGSREEFARLLTLFSGHP